VTPGWPTRAAPSEIAVVAVAAGVVVAAVIALVLVRDIGIARVVCLP